MHFNTWFNDLHVIGLSLISLQLFWSLYHIMIVNTDLQEDFLASITITDARKVQWIDTYFSEWFWSIWGLPQYKSAPKIVGVLTERYHINDKKKKWKTRKKEERVKLFLNIAFTAKVILTKIYRKKKGLKNSQSISCHGKVKWK